jgi:hypothetical protein
MTEKGASSAAAVKSFFDVTNPKEADQGRKRARTRPEAVSESSGQTPR